MGEISHLYLSETYAENQNGFSADVFRLSVQVALSICFFFTRAMSGAILYS